MLNFYVLGIVSSSVRAVSEACVSCHCSWRCIFDWVCCGLASSGIEYWVLRGQAICVYAHCALWETCFTNKGLYWLNVATVECYFWRCNDYLLWRVKCRFREGLGLEFWLKSRCSIPVYFDSLAVWTAPPQTQLQCDGKDWNVFKAVNSSVTTEWIIGGTLGAVDTVF